MVNNVIPFDTGRPPAIFAGRQSSLNAAAKQGVQESFAVIGIRGKNWRIKYRGDEELIKDASGMPMQQLPVVIVGVSPFIAKNYYEGGYTEGSDTPPDCFSVDGITPDAGAPKNQCATCVVCPKNVFGSRITEAGKKTKACADSRRIAVVPLNDIENEIYGGPMMLKLPAMTLSNLKRYAEMLDRKGATMEMVATALHFDPEAAFPRIEFQAIGWLTDAQAAQVVGPDGAGGMCAHPLIERMLQDAAVEATSDPGAPAEISALDRGAPAQVFTPAQQEAVQQQVAQQVVQQPAVVQPTVQPVQQPAAAMRGFGFAPGALTAVQQALAPAPAAAVAATTVVAAAPADMQMTIDALLAAPAAG